jgi:FAD/FMN-containing dehydrogenase
MVENMLLESELEVLPSSQFAERFIKIANEPTVRMAYGRLSVAKQGFLEEALLVSYRPVAKELRQLPAAAPSSTFSFLSRQIFRAQTGSESGKQFRWYAETALAQSISSRQVTRNAILNYPVSALADSSKRRTDILHEYFVPPLRFAEFLAGCREIIPKFKQDLLNVTLRYLEPDAISTMAFAPDRRIAAVMLFAQQMTREADNAMRSMTQDFIDHVLALGGSFYLPYRLHARIDQVKAAYPSIDKFVAGKRHYDPELRFRNLMWESYFS